MKIRRILVAALLVACALAAQARAAEHRFGLCALYWRSVHDVSGAGLDNDGAAPCFTYQYVPAGIFKLEGDLEYYPNGFGGSTSSAYSPVAFALVEFGLYAGVGIGVTVADDLPNNMSDPFYVGRVGWDFQVIPRLHLDINANYRANSFQGLKDYNTDSITFGAAARVAF